MSNGMKNNELSMYIQITQDIRGSIENEEWNETYYSKFVEEPDLRFGRTDTEFLRIV